MNNSGNCRVVIPAAGRSSRSGLSYPKSLYRLSGIPILVRIIRLMQPWDQKPVLVINPGHETLFRETLEEFNLDAEFVFQPDPRGMGQALLETAPVLQPETQVILVWSDIPLLHPHTVKHMVDCHRCSDQDFSFATALAESCYTIVKRENGKVKALIETRAAGMPPGKNGERDIGLFIFKAGPVLDMLKHHPVLTEVNGKTEQGFLAVIEQLAEAGYRVEGYPLALEQDLLSFNTPEDLQAIADSPALTGNV